MSDVSYVLQTEGEEGRRVVQVNMIQPYYRKENYVLYAIKEMPKEKPELWYWEGRSIPQHNPEEVIVSLTLAPEQQEARALLQKYKHVFSNKPAVAKGVGHKIET